jgi:hypothetical protein
LARPIDRHLTQDELEALVSSGVAQKGELSSSADDLGDVSFHVAECDGCRLLVTSYIAVEARLPFLRTSYLAPRRVDCPPDGEWPSLVSGLLTMDRTEKATLHAACCDHCGPLLRMATEDLAPSQEEESVLGGLEDWQSDLVL